MEIQEDLYKEIPLDVLFSEAQHNWERKKVKLKQRQLNVASFLFKSSICG